MYVLGTIIGPIVARGLAWTCCELGVGLADWPGT